VRTAWNERADDHIKTGMKKIDRNVDATMPPATAVPTEFRGRRAAPVATASGSTPRMNANDVIRIGADGCAADSTAASMIDSPFSRSCSANSTIRSSSSPPIRSGEPDHLTEDVIGETAHELCAERSQHGQRHDPAE
jgi:hypothetical protein